MSFSRVMRHRGWIGAAGTALLLLSPGCKKSGGGSEVVARVGDGVITASEFKARMKEQSPLIQSRYTTLEKKKEFLDNMVRMEVLAQEARRRGMDKDPEVQSALERIMIQKLLRKQYEESAKPPSEDELKAYYQQHVSEFVRPEQIRVSQIFLAAPKGSAKRAAIQTEATKLSSELKAKETGPNKMAFAQAAQQKSADAASKSSGGDLGFHTKEELTKLWGAEVADAAVALKTPGEISGPVATDRGFHVLKLMSRQPGVDQPLEMAKPRIEARLMAEARSKAVDNYVNELKSKTKVTVNEEALKRIEVKPPTPSASSYPIAPGPTVMGR